MRTAHRLLTVGALLTAPAALAERGGDPAHAPLGTGTLTTTPDDQSYCYIPTMSEMRGDVDPLGLSPGKETDPDFAVGCVSKPWIEFLPNPDPTTFTGICFLIKPFPSPGAVTRATSLRT